MKHHKQKLMWKTHQEKNNNKDFFNLIEKFYFIQWRNPKMNQYWVRVDVSLLAMKKGVVITQISMAQLARAVEYIDCISAEEKDSPNERTGYDTKQSDGKASLML